MLISPQVSSSIWSDKKFKFSYLSIPKCGCSSVKRFLRQLVDPLDSCEHVHDMSASSLVIGSSLTQDQLYSALTNGFSFTVIRDPQSRILSAYLDKFKLLHLPNLRVFVPQLIGHPLPSDEEYISFASSLTFREFLLYLVNSTAMNEHWRPYSQSISEVQAVAPHLAVEPLSSLNAVFDRISCIYAEEGGGTGKIEKLFQANTSFGHTTDASSKLATFFSDPESLHLFSHVYGKDIDMWESLREI